MGRTRYVKPSRAHKYRRADAPETSTSQHQPDHPEDAPDYTQAIYGDQTEFPIYEQTEEERRARQAAMSELEAPLFKHYDPTSEVRDAGAARYRFSGDEEERKRQQEAIRTGKASGMADGYQVDAARRAKEEAEQKELRERREEIAQRKRKLQAAKEERAKKTAKNES